MAHEQKKEVKEPEKGERAAGVLLHISSLPGRYGIGSMGQEAYQFADLLHETGIRYWQVLPLVQTGFGDSPYQSVFVSSGNPYFIDFDILIRDGLLKRSECETCVRRGDADYAFLYERKYAVLRKAYERFDTEDADFLAFEAEGFFHEYALFMTIKTLHRGCSFDLWEKPLKFRDPQALEQVLRENRKEYRFWLFLQYEFRKQWTALKAYCNGLGIRIIGDIPLYVAYDSADVWSRPELFKLNKNLSRKKVAGVPPDYFSSTGQLWGNPVYDWKVHEQEGYRWWIGRIRHAFGLYDVVRLDHFRGFDRYYEIPAEEETAVNGVWHRGPGMNLFEAAERELGHLDFIAEDLGLLDEGVYKLIRDTGFPSMKVLEFAFDGSDGNPYLPENINWNSVSYTGTHDNDTLVGYLGSLQQYEYDRLRETLLPRLKEAGISSRPESPEGIARAIVKLALSVRSRLVVLPMQDILESGPETRMNTPATDSYNWRYRLTSLPSRARFAQLREDLERFGRL